MDDGAWQAIEISERNGFLKERIAILILAVFPTPRGNTQKDDRAAHFGVPHLQGWWNQGRVFLGLNVHPSPHRHFQRTLAVEGIEVIQRFGTSPLYRGLYLRRVPGAHMATVLVVEDEEQVLVLAESILQDNGLETLSAHGVDGALALLADNERTIDLLFTDIGLHGGSHGGIELAQEAVRLRPKLPVLYTSGQVMTDGMQAQFVEKSLFLPKPYTSDQLIQAIKEMRV
jgi:CheY-like chemotaxis protein